MVSSTPCGVAVVVVMVSSAPCGVAVVVVMVSSTPCGVAVALVIVISYKASGSQQGSGKKATRTIEGSKGLSR